MAKEDPRILHPDTEMRLYPHQHEALEDVRLKIAERQDTIISGYAGTGKSFMIKALTKLFPGLAVVSETGKATQVLAQNGVSASTIKSTFYYFAGEVSICNNCDATEPASEQKDEEITPCGVCGKQAGYKASMDFVSKLSTDKGRSEVEDAVRGGVLIDEASMVSAATLAEIRRSAPFVVAVGDPFQLPPVGESGDESTPGFDLWKPDVLLTEVVRVKSKKAQGITDLATDIRKKYKPTGRIQPKTIRALAEKHGLEVVRGVDTMLDRLCVDGSFNHNAQIIAGRAMAVYLLNVAVRMRRYSAEELLPKDRFVFHPLEGDLVIARKNDNVEGRWVNGEQFWVTRQADSSSQHGSARTRMWPRGVPHNEDGDGVLAVMSANGLSMVKPSLKKLEGFQWFGFGYAITCHRAQGSGWHTVYVVLDATVPAERANWLYTAVTRAKRNLVLVEPDSSDELSVRPPYQGIPSWDDKGQEIKMREMSQLVREVMA